MGRAAGIGVFLTFALLGLFGTECGCGSVRPAAPVWALALLALAAAAFTLLRR